MRKCIAYDKLVTAAACGLLLLLTSGCSKIVQHGYFAPVRSDNWVQSEKGTLPAANVSCSNKNIEVFPTLFYEYTYTVGPAVFPIIPVFNLGGGNTAADSFTISLRVKPSQPMTGTDTTRLSLFMPNSRQRIVPDSVLVQEVADTDVRIISATFRADVPSLHAFILSFDTAIEGCALSPLKFDRIFKTELVPTPRIIIQ